MRALTSLVVAGAFTGQGGVLMKRTVMVVVLAIALFATSVAPALAASTQKYTLVLPRFGGSYYTSTKTLSAYRDIGVKHSYSGGKSVNFQVCDSQKKRLARA